MSWFSNIFGNSEGGAEPAKSSPASAAEIAAWEEGVGVKLPPTVAALYSQSDGVKPEDARVGNILRLMPLKEVAETHGNLLQTGLAGMLKRYGMVFFWTDDSSNYAGVFCSGVFEGRVFFLDHDGYYLGTCRRYSGRWSRSFHVLRRRRRGIRSLMLSRRGRSKMKS